MFFSLGDLSENIWTKEDREKYKYNQQYYKRINMTTEDKKEIEENIFTSTRGNFYDEKGRPYLVRCPACERENYSMMVAVGRCAWCGYKAPEGTVFNGGC